mmetsp:Transcript_27981/g.80188  ORF Transcript_27981/g.80188 Transcript_27981/m.80188 type:complete len:348 (+) Transcript_27981:42-1085(+)
MAAPPPPGGRGVPTCLPSQMPLVWPKEPLRRRGPRRHASLVALARFAGAAVAFLVASAGLLSCWLPHAAFVSGARVDMRGRHRAAQVGCRFFQNGFDAFKNPVEAVMQAYEETGKVVVDSEYRELLMFLAESFEMFLPKGKKGAMLRMVEIDPGPPVKGKYISLMSPADRRWYLDNYIAVGPDLDPTKKVDAIENQGKVATCKVEYVRWDSPKQEMGISKGHADMVLMSEGAAHRLKGKGLLAGALREAKRILKPKGRFYLVMDKKDEIALEGTAQASLVGSLLDRAGFAVGNARGNGDLSIAYAMKKKAMEGLMPHDLFAGKRKTGFGTSGPNAKSLGEALGLDDI